MKKLIKRTVSVLLAIVLLICSFSGCAGGIIEADANDYLTKGEWFNYFVEEVGLEYYEDFKIQLSIDDSWDYYEAVYSIVEFGICSSDVACDSLDNCVTRDVIAFTCVNYIPNAYRKEINNNFKDEDKITDIKAANESIEYGILESISKTKFCPDRFVTIDECEQAINATMDYEANYEFSPEESNTEIVYNDNVIELDENIVEVVSSDVHDEISNYDEQSLITDLINTNEVEVSALGKANNNLSETNTSTDYTDTISVKIEKSLYENNKSAYEIGNIIKFAPFDVYTNKNKTPVSVCYLEITKKPELDSLKKYYIITGDLPANNKVINRIGDNQKDTSKLIDRNRSEKYNKSSLGVTGVSITENGVSFTYTKKGSTKKSKSTDPTYSGAYSVKVEVSNFSLTTTGLDSVFKDISKNDLDATIKLKYDTNFDVIAQSDTVRFAPYNNGNGKFPSNLSRSRLTTGDGANSIKICKIVIPVADTPLNFSFGLYLNFSIDGELSIEIKRENVRGVHIKGMQVTPIKESKSKTKIEAKVNLYAGIEFRATFGITGIRTPIADFNAGVGFDLLCTATGYLMNKENKYTYKQGCPNLTGNMLDDVISSRKGNDFNYCLDLNFSLQIYINGITNNCYVGKLLKFVAPTYSPPSKEWRFPLNSCHYEDGKFVSNCTRTAAENADVEKTLQLRSGDKIDISEYNLVLNDNMCSQFYVTQVPGKEKNIEKIADELKVYSSNKKICNATYFSTTHMVSIEPVGVGSCEVIIETKGGKDKMSCAIIINSSKEVVFVPDYLHFSQSMLSV